MDGFLDAAADCVDWKVFSRYTWASVDILIIVGRQLLIQCYLRTHTRRFAQTPWIFHNILLSRCRNTTFPCNFAFWIIFWNLFLILWIWHKILSYNPSLHRKIKPLVDASFTANPDILDRHQIMWWVSNLPECSVLEYHFVFLCVSSNFF